MGVLSQGDQHGGTKNVSKNSFLSKTKLFYRTMGSKRLMYKARIKENTQASILSYLTHYIFTVIILVCISLLFTSLHKNILGWPKHSFG